MIGATMRTVLVLLRVSSADSGIGDEVGVSDSDELVDKKVVAFSDTVLGGSGSPSSKDTTNESTKIVD